MRQRTRGGGEVGGRKLTCASSAMVMDEKMSLKGKNGCGYERDGMSRWCASDKIEGARKVG